MSEVVGDQVPLLHPLPLLLRHLVLRLPPAPPPNKTQVGERLHHHRSSLEEKGFQLLLEKRSGFALPRENRIWHAQQKLRIGYISVGVGDTLSDSLQFLNFAKK